jgi:UDP-N-acetylmuramoyl-tripeptide--D-alanyl-D-alanine ligase
MNIAALYEKFLLSTGVCTDTRSLQKNQIFFALKGGNFNGNQYAKQALDAGASFAVIDETSYATDERYILVEDVLTTLQALAKHHRETLGIPILAITGSNGKTSTKELLHLVLSCKFKTFATQGNLNNHIGVPLSLLSLQASHEMAVIEMGANHQKEIEAYCTWALPNFGIINNIGKAHLEGFGGIEGVIKGKTELYTAIEMNQGTIFYNADDAILQEQCMKVSKRISYGTSSLSNYSYEIDVSSNFVKVRAGGVEIQSNLLGDYNGINIGAALAVGQFFGVDIHLMKEAIETYYPKNNRSQIVEWKNNQVILDAYNANPTSMAAALQSFAAFPAQRKAVFLGAMFEIGETSIVEHAKIVDLVSTLGFDLAVFVGKDFYVNKQEGSYFFESTEAAKTFFQAQNFENYTLFIKGSRGMKMESLLDL